MYTIRYDTIGRRHTADIRGLGTASRQGARAPRWVEEVEPLDEPYFAVPFPRLRPHLLRAAPVAFTRRNLFVDASVGDRV